MSVLYHYVKYAIHSVPLYIDKLHIFLPFPSYQSGLVILKPRLINLVIYVLPISSVGRQKGLTTDHFNIQLDPFASKLTIYHYTAAVTRMYKKEMYG